MTSDERQFWGGGLVTVFLVAIAAGLVPGGSVAGSLVEAVAFVVAVAVLLGVVVVIAKVREGIRMPPVLDEERAAKGPVGDGWR